MDPEDPSTDSVTILSSAEEDLQAKARQLNTQLGDCMLDASWRWTVGAVALSIPLSVYRKSLWPLVGLGAAGSAADLYVSQSKCQAEREAWQECQRRIAEQQ